MDAIVVISDEHIGSYFGLCPPDGLRLDGGGLIKQNKFQQTSWKFWEDCWGNYIPEKIKGCNKKIIVNNGDVIDGNHHEAVDIIPNIESQQANAVEILKPVGKLFDAYFQVRGTEAHVGSSGQYEEAIAKSLSKEPGINIVQDKITGDYSRNEVWLQQEDVVMQFAHHIGTTSSAAYETSALMRELVASLVESAQWERRQPDIVVRSHRHRYCYVPIPTKGSDIACIVTPGWQLKTGFAFRVDRMRMPHIGVVVILVENGEWQSKKKLYPLPLPTLETV